MKKILKITVKVLFIMIILFGMLIGKSVFATSLENSKLVTGTENLVNAIISWLTRYWDYDMRWLLYLLCVLFKNK